MDPPHPLADVFVGRRAVSPSTRQFTIYERDRHGMAGADFNGDGHIDAFVTRGGVSGNIERYRGMIEDELLLKGAKTPREVVVAMKDSWETLRSKYTRQ